MKFGYKNASKVVTLYDKLFNIYLKKTNQECLNDE